MVFWYRPQPAESMDTLLIKSIADQKVKEQEKNIWAASPWKDIATLENNNVGLVGENFIQSICERLGIPSSIDGSKTKAVGGGAGDGTIYGETVEIKTARAGTGKSMTFQHELGEKPWLAKYMIFIDIAPNCFFITIFQNFTEEHYKSGNKCPHVFTTRKVTRRKKSKDGLHGGAFKLDTSFKLCSTYAKQGNTLCWYPTTKDDEICKYIATKFGKM